MSDQPKKAMSRTRFLQLSGAGLGAAALLASPARVAAQSSGSYIDYQTHTPGRFSSGQMTSQPITTSIAFDTLIPSFEAVIPAGGGLVMEVRVRYRGGWSGWLSLGTYSPTADSASAGTTLSDWLVNVDTIESRHGERADAYQYRLTSEGQSPTVSSVALVASQSSRHGEPIYVGTLDRVWGKDLPTPLRSQYDYEGGGEVWCSPTSLNMVMGYYGLGESVPQTAEGVRDFNYGWGNWPFNIAYAAHRGLAASVTRFNAVQQLERWIDADIPVIASIAWDNRGGAPLLDNAAITWSYGHLLVVRGFTGSGDIIAADPAGSPRSEVRRVYDREQFARAWEYGSGGVVYLAYPLGRQTPWPYASNGSW